MTSATFKPVLGDLIKAGKVRTEGWVDLGSSKYRHGRQAGAPKPGISSLDALTKTILATTELFQRLGIADRIKGKASL